MENQLMETSPFDIINEYCILEIIKYFDMTDYINFINCSKHLMEISKRWTNWKFSKLCLDAKWIGTNRNTERTFASIGRHLKELVVDFEGMNEDNIEKTLKSISKHFIGLKRLCFRNHKSVRKYNNLAFSNVETLIFTWCDRHIIKKCLQSFGRVKFLSFHDCNIRGITIDDWTTLFQSNQSIEGIVLPNGFNDCEVLHLLPRLEKLYGWHSVDQKKTSVKLNSLLQCKRLTKLRLMCDDSDRHDLFNGLCNGDIIDELALTWLGAFNPTIFDALKASRKMKILVLWLDGALLPSLTWPANLKKLRLTSCNIVWFDLVDIIKQLNHLEKLDLLHCKIVDQHGAPYDNPVQLARLISNAYKTSGDQQLLNVRMPYSYYKVVESMPKTDDPSKKIIKILDRNEQMEIETYTAFDIIRL